MVSKNGQIAKVLLKPMACLVINQGLPSVTDHVERMWLILFVVWYLVLLLEDMLLSISSNCEFVLIDEKGLNIHSGLIN